eukprot:EG_transcript_23105
MADHLTRTQHAPRVSEPYHTCHITHLWAETPTVRGVRLRPVGFPPPFAFRPGQWVDFAIPGVPTVGGFSIVSSPAQLAEQGTLELAVKASPHPPARGVHESGEVGSEVAIRIGGSFSPPGGAPRDLLLVAGGIGINPLLSMIRAYADRADPAPAGVPRVALLYSAATQAELAFRPLLDELALTHRWLQCTYFVTREPPSSAEVHGRRLEPTDMRRAAAGLRRPLCCLCGPPPMVDAVEAWAEAAGVAQGDVMVEKWW